MAEQLTIALCRIANQIEDEASNWSGGLRRNLLRSSAHVRSVMRAGWTTPAQRQVAERTLAAGIDVMVEALADRAWRDEDARR